MPARSAMRLIVVPCRPCWANSAVAACCSLRRVCSVCPAPGPTIPLESALRWSPTTTLELLMQIDLTDKVIVVTGAAQGIGRTLALGLAEEGARVAVVARALERAQTVADECGGLAVEADVADEAAVADAVAAVDRAFGRVDGLINNAGWMPGSHPVLDMPLDVFEGVLRANLVSSFLCTKHF